MTESRKSGVLIAFIFFRFIVFVGLPKLPFGKFSRASSNRTHGQRRRRAAALAAAALTC